MKYRYWPSWAVLSIAACMLLITSTFSSISSFSTFSYASAFSAPVLPPIIEIRYQAALADEHALPAGDANLNDRLRSIDIRTALEDTGRLRYDLG
ncbi:hypothetical protein NL532_24125 [Mesorhizobium sp. C120A]|uniref:hypothetical protein n=1 Tax=unclassified Mesorhizobium TaxID=325217 RepID=UPI0012DF907B|nr:MULTISPECIES: hypothetical protein [unclassified Mesorhizobium]WJI43697.1 hypothetical protein NL532_24125 [Mesorhizobium sp. C120A]